MTVLPLGAIPPTVVTARLLLVAASAETAASADAGALARLLGVAVPPDYDAADVKDVMPGYADSLREDPTCLGWGPWFMVAPAEGMLVGNLGFYGRASADGVVEMGYEVFAAYRGRGYATESLRGLTRWAFDHGVRVATARCEPANAASAAVLRKAGFACVDAGDVLYWRLAAGDGGDASD